MKMHSERILPLRERDEALGHEARAEWRTNYDKELTSLHLEDCPDFGRTPTP